VDRKKQIERLKKKATRIQKWLQENDAKVGDRGKEVKSNITDNDSATMATAHGTLQGYNGQALVDGKHQVIVHGEAFGKGQDTRHLGPMIDGAKENMESIGHSEGYFRDKPFAADADYHSMRNLEKSIEEGLDAYIPDKLFRRRAPGLSPRRRWLRGENKFCLEDFKYEPEADQYVCPEGRILNLQASKVFTTGNFYRRYVADPKDCDRCMSRHKCLADRKGSRKSLSVPIFTEGMNLSKQMAGKIDSAEGRRMYQKRMAIVEPVFANIRIQKRLDRFTLRGKVKVNIQWLLYCMVHNIEKITNYGHAYAQ
jgi:hypothetical protein